MVSNIYYFSTKTSSSQVLQGLGAVDNSSRVGAVASSSGASSSDSGDGSRGKAGDVHGVGGGDIGVATGNDGGVDEGSGGGDNGSGDSLDLSNSGGSGDDGGGGDGVGVVGVAKAIVVSVGVAGVASESGVSKTVVSGVAESVVSVGVVRVSLGISLSLPLGNMDDSSRVGDVTSVASVQEVGVGLSLRGSHSGHGHAGDSKELVHLDVFRIREEHYPLNSQ